MSTDTLTPPTIPASAEAPPAQIPIVRISPDNATVLAHLGLLQEFAGTWHGHGFNLIGRPDGQNKQNVYLQLNQTQESLKVDPIGSSISESRVWPEGHRTVRPDLPPEDQ